jgi:hypothetical protein
LIHLGWLFGNGDVSGWRGKRNRPRWKTSTEWQRRETVANHAAGIAPSAPTRSLEVTRCGSTESRENNRIHLGPRGRNGPLGAKLGDGRFAQKLHHLGGGRAFTRPNQLNSSLATSFSVVRPPRCRGGIRGRRWRWCGGRPGGRLRRRQSGGQGRPGGSSAGEGRRRRGGGRRVPRV